MRRRRPTFSCPRVRLLLTPFLIRPPRSPQADALNHECPRAVAAAGQVSGTHSHSHSCCASRVYISVLADPSYSFTRESLNQYVEGGLGQGPRAQSASVRSCLLFAGSWPSSPSPHPPLPSTFSTLPAPVAFPGCSICSESQANLASAPAALPSSQSPFLTFLRACFYET